MQDLEAGLTASMGPENPGYVKTSLFRNLRLIESLISWIRLLTRDRNQMINHNVQIGKWRKIGRELLVRKRDQGPRGFWGSISKANVWVKGKIARRYWQHISNCQMLGRKEASPRSTNQLGIYIVAAGSYSQHAKDKVGGGGIHSWFGWFASYKGFLEDLLIEDWLTLSDPC